MEVEILDKSENKVRFILKGTSPPFANALRRIMVAEVPSMTIDDVVIVENTSAMNDEVLAHRLGFIPLKTDLKTYVLPENCTCKSELGCNHCRVILTLEAEAGDSRREVYSDDLKPDDQQTIPVSGIPIVKLTPGQKVRLEAYARLGRGKTHAKWQPVSACAYKFLPLVTINTKKCDTCGECVKTCSKKILQVKDGKLAITEILKCTLCRDCVKTCPKDAINVSWDETTFIFKLESTGALSVDQIVKEATNILERKTKDLSKEIAKLR